MGKIRDVGRKAGIKSASVIRFVATAVLSSVTAIILILFWGGLLFNFVGMIAGVIDLTEWNPRLPSSASELVGGIFVSAFIGFMLSLGFVPLLSLVETKWDLSNVGFALTWFALTLTSGGILIFVVPTWVACVSLAIAVGISIIGSMRE